MSNVDKIQVTYDFFDSPENLKRISDTEARMKYVADVIQKLADERGISVREARSIYMKGEFKPQEDDNK